METPFTYVTPADARRRARAARTRILAAYTKQSRRPLACRAFDDLFECGEGATVCAAFRLLFGQDDATREACASWYAHDYASGLVAPHPSDEYEKRVQAAMDAFAALPNRRALA